MKRLDPKDYPAYVEKLRDYLAGRDLDSVVGDLTALVERGPEGRTRNLLEAALLRVTTQAELLTAAADFLQLQDRTITDLKADLAAINDLSTRSLNGVELEAPAMQSDAPALAPEGARGRTDWTQALIPVDNSDVAPVHAGYPAGHAGNADHAPLLPAQALIAPVGHDPMTQALIGKASNVKPPMPAQDPANNEITANQPEPVAAQPVSNAPTRSSDGGMSR